MLVGGAEAEPLRHAAADGALLAALRAAYEGAERVGSVCSGAFLLGAAGLLAGRRATTHWAGEAAFAALYPGVLAPGSPLYVRDGRVWTSAGVTTGIDLALAMVEADHGAGLRARVARRLVVYAHRPGHQAQFSEMLLAQERAAGPLAGLLDRLATRLDAPPDVAEMAERLGVSARSLQRQCVAQFGRSPARLLAELRLDRARSLLEAGQPVKAVAARAGFRSEAAFRAAFKARYGVPPGFRARLGAGAGAATA